MKLSDFDLVPTKAKAIRPGDRFGRLSVVEVGQIEGTYRYYAVCQCDCMSMLKSIRQDGLTSGAVVSCGCYHSEVVSTHQMTNSPHFGRWQNMMDRCYNEECASYLDYGGRGIKVCAEWHDVENYVDGLPSGYFDGAHLDRIDNDGNYQPDNVRWVTPQQNHNNRRSTRRLTLGDCTMTTQEWSTITGIPSSVILNRLNNEGWTVEAALTTPVLSDKFERMKRAHEFRWKDHVKKGPKTDRVEHKVEFNGEAVTLAQLAERTGITRKLLYKRIFERGWSVDRAASTK